MCLQDLKFETKKVDFIFNLSDILALYGTMRRVWRTRKLWLSIFHIPSAFFSYHTGIKNKTYQHKQKAFLCLRVLVLKCLFWFS